MLILVSETPSPPQQARAKSFVSERARHRATERQSDGETERQRDRETERQRDREMARPRDRWTGGQTENSVMGWSGECACERTQDQSLLIGTWTIPHSSCRLAAARLWFFSGSGRNGVKY